MIKASFAAMNEADKIAWASKQAYIGLGFAIALCAELQIDSGPMEGFDKNEFKKILKMPEHFYPQALLAVGYRSKEENSRIKNRAPQEILFTNL
jgi:nitroreductase